MDNDLIMLALLTIIALLLSHITLRSHYKDVLQSLNKKYSDLKAEHDELKNKFNDVAGIHLFANDIDEVHKESVRYGDVLQSIAGLRATVEKLELKSNRRYKVLHKYAMKYKTKKVKTTKPTEKSK